MKAWSEMSYDEQRAALGLWRPTYAFHWGRLRAVYGTAFGPLARMLCRTRDTHTRASDYALAGEK